MEKLVIMGAGQFGRAAAALINRESFSVLAAADRDSRLWGSSMDGIPVMSPQEAMALNPDTLLISVSAWDFMEKSSFWMRCADILIFVPLYCFVSVDV